MLRGAVFKTYVRPSIMYGSEAWYLNKGKVEILQRTEISMVRAMYGVHLRRIKG